MSIYKDNEMMACIMEELRRARTKFPDQSDLVTLPGLSEEVGELNEAVLDFKYIAAEHRKGKTYADVKKEAVQVAVMAIRVALDCDLEGHTDDK